MFQRTNAFGGLKTEARRGDLGSSRSGRARHSPAAQPSRRTWPIPCMAACSRRCCQRPSQACTAARLPASPSSSSSARRTEARRTGRPRPARRRAPSTGRCTARGRSRPPGAWWTTPSSARWGSRRGAGVGRRLVRVNLSDHQDRTRPTHQNLQFGRGARSAPSRCGPRLHVQSPGVYRTGLGASRQLCLVLSSTYSCAGVSRHH